MTPTLNKQNQSGKVILINYADNVYKKSQKLNTATANSIGQFDKIISFSPRNIDEKFKSKNHTILSQKRGNGYWLWKPYFIKKTLDEINFGDFLFYCDSGSYFVNSIRELVEFSIKMQQDVIPFELSHFEKEWTKRDAFILMDCDSEKYFNSKQRLVSFVLIRKSALSMQFVTEWLNFAQDERIITDMPNQLEMPNYVGFKDHRHDQSIFSLLSKKYNFVAHRDPSQYGNEYQEWYPNSNYKQLLHLHRKRNFPLHIRIKKYIARKLNSIKNQLKK